ERHSSRTPLARHTHVTRRTSRRHKFLPWSQVLGIGSEVVAGGPAVERSHRQVPWFDRCPAIASAWQMSGSVPVKHRPVRTGQDAEDLVDVLSDESRHARISHTNFLARGARKGLRRAGPLLASGTAGLG